MRAVHAIRIIHFNVQESTSHASLRVYSGYTNDFNGT